MNNSIALIDQSSLVECRRDPVNHPRLHQFSEDDATSKMIEILTMAHLYLGRNADMRQEAFIARELVRNLLSERVYGCRNITFEEISYCIKNAIMTSPSDFFITIPSIYKVIVGYAKGEGSQINEKAYKQIQAERKAALNASPVGALINAQVGAMYSQSKNQ